jgi:AraC-like DNA-binding protein
LIEVYYAPDTESIVHFPGGKKFTTIDFHLQPELLEFYRSHFPILDRFLEKVAKKEPARLFNSLQFTTPAIDQTIKTFISYHFIDELAPKYYENLLHIFIIQLLESIDNFTNHTRKISASDCEKAVEAKRLLTTDFEKSYTIKELCRILHTNPYNLKVSFRHLFNTSIGRYKKSVLMEKAKFLLLETSKTIDEISIELGYSSQQSFTAAFRNYYKVAPGYWKKIQ